MTDPWTAAPEAELKAGPGPGGAVPRSMAPANVVEPVKCRAHTSAGAPCKRWAIVGGFVCATHGGSAPQVRRAANQRILAIAPRAVQVAVELMEHSESDVVRLRAAQDLMDRGLGKAVDVTLDITPQDGSTGPSPLDLAIAAALKARQLEPGDQGGDVVELEEGADGVHQVPEET